ncbi:MAG TPA: hypothetical protein VMH26_18270 [Burkholderiales bacterium]|nr:hypothetical protein [Burkholderiales bacterium]
MPSVSRAQQKAMHAAAAGHSTIGIPKSVGEDFAAADHARGPTKLPEHVSKHKGFTDSMKSHGVAAGPNKRHPSTQHYGMGPDGNKFRKR